jgi:succinoglycan biosynthesis protein ExoH
MSIWFYRIFFDGNNDFFYQHIAQTMRMKLSKDVSSRIAMLRPILIFGVVFVHVAGMSDLPSEVPPGLFMTFASYVKNAVFRGTVPTMSLIAGFLLFSQGLDLLPSKMFRKKFLTLFVPFMLLNMACYLMMDTFNGAFGPQVFPGFHVMQQVTGDWGFERLNRVFGITMYPINGPLHFVRDMLVTLLFVPIMSGLIRKAPWAGLAAIAVFFGFDFDGPLIMRATSLMLFYIGGVAAVHGWNVLGADKYARQCLLAFLVMCAVLIAFRIDDNTFLVIVAPFLMWPAASLLRHTRIEGWAIKYSKYSFFVFAAHWPFMTLAWWMLKTHVRWLPFPVFWAISPILTILLLKVVYDAAMLVAPNVFNVIIGTRARKPAFVERRKSPRPVNAPVWSEDDRKLVGL